MSKPLTIEELKALPVGDWVWIIDKENNMKFYHQIESERFDYSYYGTDWLAYKNKEQAEGKDEQIRKDVAKDILTTLVDWSDRETPLKADIQELADKYGVEVDE